MTPQHAPQLVSFGQQRYYAERLIDDLNVLERKRNLSVNELDARTVARWLLLALPQQDHPGETAQPTTRPAGPVTKG